MALKLKHEAVSECKSRGTLEVVFFTSWVLYFYKQLEIHTLIKVLEWVGEMSVFLSSSFATHCKYIQICI